MKFITIAAVLISCAMAIAPSPFLGKQLEERQLVHPGHEEASNECIKAVIGIKILEQTCAFILGSSPPRFQMLLDIDTNLTECAKGNGGHKSDALIHRVYFTSRDNEHKAPNMKILNDTDYARPFTYKDDMTNAQLDSKYQATWEQFGKNQNPERNMDALNAAVKHQFYYEWTNPKVEQLQAEDFYPKNPPIIINNATGAKHEEWKAYIIHTIWLSQTDTITRWFEWSIVMRTYIDLKPFKSRKYKVVAKEILGPVCDDCEMNVTHSGQVIFVEERVTTAASGYPDTITFLPNGCDWNTPRDGYQFTSLQQVCFRLQLEDRTSDRKFMLQKLTYGYNDRAVSSMTLVDKQAAIRSGSLKQDTWDDVKKWLKIELTLKLGAVEELVYEISVKLCSLGSDVNNNVCVARRRMLGGKRGRYLATKTQVQQYTTESTANCGKNGNCVKEESKNPTSSADETEKKGGAGAVIAVVAILALAGIGFGVFKFIQGKPSTGGDNVVGEQGHQNIPSQPNNNLQGANEQQNRE